MSRAQAVELQLEPPLLCTCGYDLRGISLHGRCPECGEPILPAQWNLLWNADPRWLCRLRDGAILLTVGQWLVACLCCCAVVILARFASPFSRLPWMAVGLSQFVGVYFLTWPEPGVPLRHQRVARLTRDVAAIEVAVRVLYWYANTWLDFHNGWARPTYDLLAAVTAADAVLWTLWTGLLCWHLCALVRRLTWGRMAWLLWLVWFSWALGAMSPHLYRLANYITGPRMVPPGSHDWIDEVRSLCDTGPMPAILSVIILVVAWAVFNLCLRGITCHLRPGSHPLLVGSSITFVHSLRARITR